MLLIEILWATAILGQARAIGLEPLLESNRPPYTLINFALEQDTRVDQIGELQRQQAQGRRTRLATQFNRRRDWLDNQFNELKDKQMNNRAGKDRSCLRNIQSSVYITMIRYSRPIAAVIKPSGLTVRLPKNIIADDNRNINIALKPIRKELGIHKASHDPKTAHTHPSDPEKLEEAKVNLKNKMHKSLWLTMKRKDAPQFYNLEKQIRASNINMDGITYTLLIHGYIMFKGQHGPYQDLLDEMKLQGIHPALIRFNARIAASCVEMHGHGAKPDPTNVAQMARAAWLTAVLITRRYPTQEHILNMEKRIEREYNLVNKNYGLETLASHNADKQ